MLDEQMKVVFLDRSAIRVPLRRLSFPHRWFEYPTTSADLVVERLQGAEIAVTNRVYITEEVLQHLPDLRLIALSATGFECIDIAACSRRGVAVTNLRNWSTLSVAEHTFAMLLALRRQLFTYRELVSRGEWQRSASYGLLEEPLPGDLFGSRLGIIGYGDLGKRLGQLGLAFGMQVSIAERRGAIPRAGRTDFTEVLKNADVLCIACPLNPETRGLIGEAELAAMKPTATLINTARGGIVDERALAEALENGRLGGAGIDVLAQEPPPQDNPLLNLSRPNLVLTPHMAFASPRALNALAGQLIDNIESFVRGKPVNLVSSREYPSARASVRHFD